MDESKMRYAADIPQRTLADALQNDIFLGLSVSLIIVTPEMIMPMAPNLNFWH